MKKMKRTYKNYIKSSDSLKDIFAKFNSFSFEYKIPIKKIKLDRKLFDFDNSVNMDDVNYMIENFDESVWDPNYHKYRLLFA